MEVCDSGNAESPYALHDAFGGGGERFLDD